jgi:hypothetical protein
MVHVQIAGMVREDPLGRESQQRLLHRFDDREMWNHIKLDVFEFESEGVFDADDAVRLRDLFSKDVQGRPAVPRIRRGTKHARVDIVTLIGELAQCAATTEDLIVRMGDDGEDIQSANPLSRGISGPGAYAIHAFRAIQEMHPKCNWRKIAQR